MALERARRKASADLVQAKADLRAKQAELTRQKEKLDKIKDQIEKTRITAPRDGLVVYATSTEFSWRGNQEPLAEGQEVRERQDLIHLPATDTMMVEVKVPEAKLQLLKNGLPAAIRVDALPGRSYTGHVIKIAPLPNATSVFLNPDLKVYDTQVLFDETEDALRTGMSCTVEIIAAKYDDALYVPLHAVLRQGTQPVVYVKRNTGFEAQPVEIGLDDNRLIHIKKGLEPGDIVLLTPPMSGTAVNAAPENDGDRPETEKTISTQAGTKVQNAAPAPPVEAESDTASAEDRQAARRERLKNMTPEQRRELRESRERSHSGADGPQRPSQEAADE